MSWFGGVPLELHVAGSRFWLAQEALEAACPESYDLESRGERPDTDWAAMSIFMLARLQLDQLVSLLEKEFEIPVAALSGTEVSRRLMLAVGDMSALPPEMDRTYEITCIGEAVDLWRALLHDADSVVGHAFEVDGSITLTLGPDLPELPALGIRASDGGELNTSPTDVFGVASSCIRDAAQLAALRDRRDVFAAANESAPPVFSSPAAPYMSLLASVADHFSIWSWGSEQALVQWAAELLPHPDDDVAEAKASAYLMSLWALHLELAAYSGEGSPGAWRYEIGGWVNDGMSVDHLRRLNQADELGWDLNDDEEFEVPMADVCVSVVEHYSREVVEALLKDLGDAYTFAYFWATRYADVPYPLSPELVGEICNDESVLADDPQNKLPAFNWVQSGMHL